MRELILNRIEEIKNLYHKSGFSKDTMRWKNFYDETGKIHISEMKFSDLDDEALLRFFERYIKQCSKMM
jgi:hypothetical protein